MIKLGMFTTLILVLSLENIRAARTLEGEEWLQKKNVLIFQSLQRGPVKGSQKNPCSTVPGRSRGRCTLAEIHVAGHAPPPKFGGISKEELKALAESQKYIHIHTKINAI